MKKALAIILACLMVFSLFACQTGTGTSPTPSPSPSASETASGPRSFQERAVVPSEVSGQSASAAGLDGDGLDHLIAPTRCARRKHCYQRLCQDSDGYSVREAGRPCRSG